MSQIIEYFRSLFNNTSNNNSRKRRRVELIAEEPLPKYKKVTNIFPKTYTSLLEENDEFFQEVKQKKPLYNDLLENFFMDQQKKQLKAVLNDGEFSDEEDAILRMPPNSYARNNPGYDFQNYFQHSQPSTSASAFRSNRYFGGRPQQQRLANGASDSKDRDVQFVSMTRKPMSSSTSSAPPPLVPISRLAQASMMFNGNSTSEANTSRSISMQPVRGRRSILDFGKKNRAFNEPPKVSNSNSILYRNHNLAVKSEYNDLLKSLIPSFSRAALAKQSNVKNSKPVDTIDLCDDTENVPANNIKESLPPSQSTSTFNKASTYTGNKIDFKFKKPTAYVEIDDDDEEEGNQTQFFPSPGFSSTQIIKTRDLDSSPVVSDDKSKKQQQSSSSLLKIGDISINSLKERHSIRDSLQDDKIQKIINRYHQVQAEKNKTIKEEEKNVSELEKDRLRHERIQQKRIDDQITSALTEKCIIIDEEEDVIDEFPPLNEQQNRIVSFALHGSRSEIIVSKFNMNITRHDFATLDGLNWLNDEVINFYMELIKERSEQVEHLPKVHVMNTFFLGKLLQNGHSGVRRWTRKVDIFGVDIIPIPVHVGGVHWCMSIIHMKNKTIRYYDSMGHPNHHVLEALEQYLKDESMDKKKVPFDTSDWTMECVRDCPQQKNGSDCGVFSCQFAEFISRDSPVSFEQQHMPYFRRKMIYEIATGKLLLGT